LQVACDLPVRVIIWPVRRIMMILSTALMTAAVVVLIDAGLTLVWQEPVSSVYASLRQSEADDQLATIETEFRDSLPDAHLPPTASPGRVEALADLFQRQLVTGKPIGRIKIPSIDIDFAVIEGTDTASLQKGPGHYPETALPGQGQTIGIAGHRTTYLAPFRDIDKIREGDKIELHMPYGDFTYSVEKTKVVDPSDVEIVDNIGRERLVLTACHPPYSAAERYAVFGRLDHVSLFGGSDGPWKAP
jgi:sortase A